MQHEQGDVSEGRGAKGPKGAGAGFFGSLKEALLAAGRDEAAGALAASPPAAGSKPAPTPVAPPAIDAQTPQQPSIAIVSPSAEEAAKLVRGGAIARPIARPALDDAPAPDSPPTTRVVRREQAAAPAAEPEPEEGPRTALVRGRQKIARGKFESDPVVGFLVVVGGPGLGSHRPIFEGNNTVGRSASNRIPLDFGDDAISADAQGYIRYDSNDRSFLFVPNLAKTNVAAVNDRRPTAAVELRAMDVITLGRTQVAFVPFCGAEFDWSEISDA